MSIIRMKNNILKSIAVYRKPFSVLFITIITVFTSSCFKNPTKFEMPTWFFDLTFPLVQQKFSFEKMVDNKQIFSTPDSIGMQLMFEGSLPDTSIGADILEVNLNQNIQFSQPAVSGPNISFSFDTTINLAIHIALDGKI